MKDSIFTGLAYCVFFLPGFLALLFLRKAKSGEIYVIWYAASLFFVLFFGLQYLAGKRHIHIAELCGSHAETCQTAMETLFHLEGELILVAAVLALGILPQLLAYFLSGVTGSASPPHFVLQVEKVAIWSLIKFNASVGGALMSRPVAIWAAGGPPDFREFCNGLVAIGSAFAIAALDVLLTERLPIFWRKRKDFFEPLASVHSFLTRHSRGSPNSHKQVRTADSL